jgi:S1/P1 nuclease
MVVASVAYRNLDSQTRAKLDKLLVLNPYYKAKWANLIPANTASDTRKRLIFMLAATWPDEIKSDGTYHNDGSRGGDVPDGSESTRNSGYDDLNRHKYWHFVDHPFSQDGTDVTSFAIPVPNAGTQIAAFREVLRSDSPSNLKSYDLVWLLHLIGDVHQPLHCTTRISTDATQGDNGGNDEIFCPVGAKSCTTASSTKLHAFWDDILGTSSKVAVADDFASNLDAPSVPGSDIADAETWIRDSFALAQKNTYIEPVEAGDGPFQATQQYTASTKELAKKQVALAGVRLALVLAADLKPAN